MRPLASRQLFLVLFLVDIASISTFLNNIRLASSIAFASSANFTRLVEFRVWTRAFRLFRISFVGTKLGLQSIDMMKSKLLKSVFFLILK